MTELLNRSMSDGAVCRPAPGAPGLLITCCLLGMVWSPPPFTFLLLLKAGATYIPSGLSFISVLFVSILCFWSPSLRPGAGIIPDLSKDSLEWRIESSGKTRTGTKPLEERKGLQLNHRKRSLGVKFSPNFHEKHARLDLGSSCKEIIRKNVLCTIHFFIKLHGIDQI